MNRRYKELIFTDHALERSRERKVDLGEAWATWRHPQKSAYAATKGAWVYQRTWNHRQIEVVAKKNDRKEWVVISVWANYVQARRSRPPTLIRIFKWMWTKLKRM